jgi:hypothetical protein
MCSFEGSSASSGSGLPKAAFECSQCAEATGQLWMPQLFTTGLYDFTNTEVAAIQKTSVTLFSYMALTGSAVPSDHQPAGTMNTSIGSGAPLNCGLSMMGEWDRSAPQAAPSMSGV